MNLKKKITEAINFIHKGDIEFAKKKLRKIIREYPLNTDANKIIADLYLQNNEYEYAIDPLKNYLIQIPKDCIMQNNLGVCYLNTGALDNAIDRFNIAVSIQKIMWTVCII